MKPIHQVLVDALGVSLPSVLPPHLNAAARDVIEALRREGYEIEPRRGA